MSEEKPDSKPKDRRGPKTKFVVTPKIIEEVAMLSGRGLTAEQIHQYYGISRGTWFNTLKKEPELHAAVVQGRSKGISFAAGKLFELVKKGDKTAIIFYLKTQGRWKEATDVEITLPNSEVPKLKGKDAVESAKIYQQFMTKD